MENDEAGENENINPDNKISNLITNLADGIAELQVFQ